MIDQNSHLQSGLFCVAIISKFNGFPIDIKQLQHHFNSSKTALTSIELARVFKNIDISAKLVDKKINQIKPAFFPLVAEMQSGEFVVLAKYDNSNQKVLVQRRTAERSTWQPVNELQSKLTNNVLVVKKNPAKTGVQKEFGFNWFWQHQPSTGAYSGIVCLHLCSSRSLPWYLHLSL